MMTLPELAVDALENFFRNYMNRLFGTMGRGFNDFVPLGVRFALEHIGNSDALYHNIEHTMLVTLAGHEIFRGRAMQMHLTVEDYAHVIIACLHHDIGYVRGIIAEDDEDGFVIDDTGDKGDAAARRLGRQSDALSCRSLESLCFEASRRLSSPSISERIASAIEGTRFPAREGQEYDAEASLLRAADFIGQLGDPNYIRKANALYYEFEEVGVNRQLGYDSPADIVNRYPQFYWNSVAPHIQTEIGYLNKTSNGRQWIANLYANVFRAEREIKLSGPQH